MKLHTFLANHRAELLAACVQDIKRDLPERRDEEVGEHLQGFLDEVIHALRHLDGSPEEEAAPAIGPADVARDRHRRGFRAQHLVPTYAVLSRALGEVAGRRGLAFEAAEYGLFNHVIDDHIAQAIEAFTDDTRLEQDREIGERLGFLAHELRNALASATMAFAMLERGHVGIHGHTADIVRRNHKRMKSLIDQTLATARVRSGVGQVARHEIALAPLLRQIESSTVCERSVSLAIDVDDALRVAGDEDLLTSAVGNLVQNAVKFSHAGATVALRARSEGDAVTIEVEDECGGLPDEKREKLFEPFAQGAPDRRGVGLGLAIAREAVHALGGTIRVRDVPGRGCIFAIRLPREGAAPSR